MFDFFFFFDALILILVVQIAIARRGNLVSLIICSEIAILFGLRVLCLADFSDDASFLLKIQGAMEPYWYAYVAAAHAICAIFLSLICSPTVPRAVYITGSIIALLMWHLDNTGNYAYVMAYTVCFTLIDISKLLCAGFCSRYHHFGRGSDSGKSLWQI